MARVTIEFLDSEDGNGNMSIKVVPPVKELLEYHKAKRLSPAQEAAIFVMDSVARKLRPDLAAKVKHAQGFRIWKPGDQV